MVVRRGQFQPMALIELADEIPPQPAPDDAPAREELIDKLLPALAEANQHAPAHAQLDRCHVLGPTAAYPPLRTGEDPANVNYRLYEDVTAAY